MGAKRPWYERRTMTWRVKTVDWQIAEEGRRKMYEFLGWDYEAQIEREKRMPSR